MLLRRRCLAVGCDRTTQGLLCVLHGILVDPETSQRLTWAREQLRRRVKLDDPETRAVYDEAVQAVRYELVRKEGWLNPAPPAANEAR